MLPRVLHVHVEAITTKQNKRHVWLAVQELSPTKQVLLPVRFVMQVHFLTLTLLNAHLVSREPMQLTPGLLNALPVLRATTQTKVGLLNAFHVLQDPLPIPLALQPVLCARQAHMHRKVRP